MKTVTIIKTTYVEFDDDEYNQLEKNGRLETEAEWRAHGMDCDFEFECE